MNRLYNMIIIKTDMDPAPVVFTIGWETVKKQESGHINT